MEAVTVKKRIPARMLTLTALFAGLTAAGAFIRIPTPWSAFTMQVFFVFMAGALLGPRYGALSQAVYLALGLAGLPVFAGGGGPMYVLQPTFGFLVSYIPAAAVTGLLCRPAGFWRIAGACLAGLAVIYLAGLPYMALILNVYLGRGVGAAALITGGMAVFLPFDALKILLTALLAQKLIPAVEKLQ